MGLPSGAQCEGTNIQQLQTPEIHVILSCTARKRGEVGDLRLGQVGCAPVRTRAERWYSMLAAADWCHEVSNLYAGEYWRAGLELVARAGRLGAVHTSVVSAGLGLVGLTERAPTYSATLSARHPDSVLACSESEPPRDIRRRWWDRMTSLTVSEETGHPRRLADLVEDGSGATVMVCLGRAYLDAVADDLLRLLGRLSEPRSGMIFGSGVPVAGLEDQWVPVPGNLRLRLGGSLGSIAPRAALAVIASSEPDPPKVDTARRAVADLAAGTAALPSHERERQSDDDIRAWLVNHLSRSPGATKTASLRRLRDEGLACEQSRFGDLFAEASELAG